MNNLYFDPAKLNFDPEEIPLTPIREQYEHPSDVRDKVYSMYRNMCNNGLMIKDIHIVSCKKIEHFGWKWYEVTISITSNSVMDRYNLTTEVVKLPYTAINF